MNNTDIIEIPLSKVKLSLLLLSSILFVVLSYWLLLRYINSHDSFFEGDSWFICIVSVLGFLMGLGGMYFFTKKLFDKKPGLVIDELGIIDNSGGLSIGRIYWTDIIDIYEYTVQVGIASKQRFVAITLQNPKDYIARQANPLKKKIMQSNEKYMGTPVSISANGLKISFDELLILIEEKMQNFKQS
ncbi:MAG: STM3941 family protein [Chitinophagales bacterium]